MCGQGGDGEAAGLDCTGFGIGIEPASRQVSPLLHQVARPHLPVLVSLLPPTPRPRSFPGQGPFGEILTSLYTYLYWA